MKMRRLIDLTFAAFMIVWVVCSAASVVLSFHRSVLGLSDGWWWVMPFSGGFAIALGVAWLMLRGVKRKLAKARQNDEAVLLELRRRTAPIQEKVKESFNAFMRSAMDGDREEAERQMARINQLNDLMDAVVGEQFPTPDDGKP